jgi:hypothetical protein
LIPSIVWKSIYINYIVVVYLDFPFIENTLNDHLRDVFKEMKIDKFNETRSYKVVLQLDEVLARLKATKNHVTRNVLKRRQNFIDWRHKNRWVAFPNTPSSPNSTYVECPSPTIRPSTPPTSMLGPIERPLTKQKML